MSSRLLITTLAATATLSLAACTPTATIDAIATPAGTVTASDAHTASSSTVWDSTTLHTFTIDYDQDDYDALIDAYVTGGEKVWISAAVTIDGVFHDDVGLKLKGNSSLRGMEADADPATLPWIVRIDKFVDGASHDGSTEFVIRGNSSATSLNEAVALDLLDATGLAAQEAIAVSLSVAGSEPMLRLVVENPDDAWMERELGDGYLYKAESGGSYAYRGDDPGAYAEAFDQEGGEDDLAPLIDFLRFLDESDDATFAAELGSHLDIDAFATYLAYQELVDNADDIDGPGNNSYLYYDPETTRMTVVNWDLNLAFGASPGHAGGGARGGGIVDGGIVDGGGGDAAGVAGGGTMRAPSERPALDNGAVLGSAGNVPAGGSNALAQRFLANEDFAGLVDAELERLAATLYDSGVAEASLEDWSQVLLGGATALVPADTIEQEATSLEGRFPS